MDVATRGVVAPGLEPPSVTGEDGHLDDIEQPGLAHESEGETEGEAEGETESPERPAELQGTGEHVPLPVNASLSDLDARLPKLGDKSESQGDGMVMPATKPRIYLVWDKTPITSFSSPRYGKPVVSRSQIQTIATHIKAIYAKNGISVTVAVISKEEHKRKRIADMVHSLRDRVNKAEKAYRASGDPGDKIHWERAKRLLLTEQADLLKAERRDSREKGNNSGARLTHRYRKIDAWVEVRSVGLGPKGRDETPSTNFTHFGLYKTATSKVYFTPGRTHNDEADPLYSTGFDAAHEALHQFLAKAQFFKTGERPKKHGSDEDAGHTNHEVNLNMSANTMMRDHLGSVPYKAGPTAKLKAAERILPQHRRLLNDFFKSY